MHHARGLSRAGRGTRIRELEATGSLEVVKRRNARVSFTNPHGCPRAAYPGTYDFRGGAPRLILVFGNDGNNERHRLQGERSFSDRVVLGNRARFLLGVKRGIGLARWSS